MISKVIDYRSIGFYERISCYPTAGQLQRKDMPTILIKNHNPTWDVRKPQTITNRWYRSLIRGCDWCHILLLLLLLLLLEMSSLVGHFHPWIWKVKFLLTCLGPAVWLMLVTSFSEGFWCGWEPSILELCRCILYRLGLNIKFTSTGSQKRRGRRFQQFTMSDEQPGTQVDIDFLPRYAWSMSK